MDLDLVTGEINRIVAIPPQNVFSFMLKQRISYDLAVSRSRNSKSDFSLVSLLRLENKLVITNSSRPYHIHMYIYIYITILYQKCQSDKINHTVVSIPLRIQQTNIEIHLFH